MTTTTTTIKWDRMSALDGQRVIWQAYGADGKLAGQVVLSEPDGVRWWTVWTAGKDGNPGTRWASFQSLHAAKAELVRRLEAPCKACNGKGYTVPAGALDESNTAPCGKCKMTGKTSTKRDA